MKTFIKRIRSIAAIRVLTLMTIFCLTGCYMLGDDSYTRQQTDFLANDVASCKQKANILMERDIAHDSSFSRTGDHPLEVSFARFDVRKQQGEYFNNCMRKSEKQ